MHLITIISHYQFSFKKFKQSSTFFQGMSHWWEKHAFGSTSRTWPSCGREKGMDLNVTIGTLHKQLGRTRRQAYRPSCWSAWCHLAPWDGLWLWSHHWSPTESPMCSPLRAGEMIKRNSFVYCIQQTKENKSDNNLTLTLFFWTNMEKTDSLFYIMAGFLVWRWSINSVDDVGIKLPERGCFWALNAALVLSRRSVGTQTKLLSLLISSFIGLFALRMIQTLSSQLLITGLRSAFSTRL